MKVVVVDDDKLVGVSLKTILEASGEVHVVGIGCAARMPSICIGIINRISS